MKITIDLDTYFTIAQVGSSIHGDLLKPNDIDIAIGFKLPFVAAKKAFTFRIGKFNFIIFHGQTVKQYTNDFDFNILRGYKSLFTKKLHLSFEAKGALHSKYIMQLRRNNELFKIYQEKQDEKINDRLEKYRTKLPKGWRLFNLNGDRIFKTKRAQINWDRKKTLEINKSIRKLRRQGRLV